MEAPQKVATFTGEIRGRRVKIFHLFSNYKFTGPADLALLLAKSQQHLGHEVIFFSGTPPHESPNHLCEIATERGIAVRSDLFLPKHFRLRQLLNDFKTLKQKIKEEKPDWIHCHLPSDHLLGCLIREKQSPPIVKSQYDLNPVKNLRGRFCRSRTDLWITPTPSATRNLCSWKISQDRILEHPPIVDLLRFQPESKETPIAKDQDSIHIGVVARMQHHRRFAELIRGFSLAAKENPSLHLHILGRGTHQEEVAKEPARQSGFADRIHFPGYLDSKLYPGHLAQMDMLIFLVPGSDGTCRAAREAMASGVPVIASRRGLLPELIPPKAGLLLDDDSPEAISLAILKLSQETGLRGDLSAGGRAHTESFCNAETLSQALESELQGRISTI